MRSALLLILATTQLACGYDAKHVIQWDSATQIWQAEASQVRVRSAQSRTFDIRDRTRVLGAMVAAFQDLGFQVNVLEEELGIVSGRKYVDLARPAFDDPTYLLYDPETLLGFHRSYRSWGPFHHRSDLVRLTATVRRRNAEQLLVRASVQFALRPVEDPEPYQHFFATLQKALLLEPSPAS